MTTCKDCNEEYGTNMFLYLTDEMWKWIECEPADYLCAVCVIKRLNKKYEYSMPVFYLTSSSDETFKITGIKFTCTQL